MKKAYTISVSNEAKDSVTATVKKFVFASEGERNTFRKEAKKLGWFTFSMGDRDITNAESALNELKAVDATDINVGSITV